MTYATVQQLIDRFGEEVLVGLTDRGPVPAGIIDGPTVDRALTDTAAMIDSHLAGRYALPLDEVPPLLTDLALAIAFYKLHRHQPNDKVRDDYKDATKALEKIQDGRQRLPIEGGTAEPEGTGGTGARVTDRERPMTADNLKGFI